jgi:hypothetical protein
MTEANAISQVTHMLSDKELLIAEHGKILNDPWVRKFNLKPSIEEFRTFLELFNEGCTWVQFTYDEKAVAGTFQSVVGNVLNNGYIDYHTAFYSSDKDKICVTRFMIANLISATGLAPLRPFHLAPPSALTSLSVYASSSLDEGTLSIHLPPTSYQLFTSFCTLLSSFSLYALYVALFYPSHSYYHIYTWYTVPTIHIPISFSVYFYLIPAHLYSGTLYQLRYLLW